MTSAWRLTRSAYDLAPVVAALLPSFKAQSRIENPDDEPFAKEVLARSINFIEIRSGIAIASQAFLWTPVYPNSPYTVPALPVPVRGVYEFTADRSGTDVSDEYFMLGNGVDLFAPQFIERDGGLYAGDVFTLLAGFDPTWQDDEPVPLPPALVDVILRYASYLWEFREAATLGQAANLTPDWFNESLAIFWIPRV